MNSGGGTQVVRDYGHVGRAFVREAVRLCGREPVALHLGVAGTTVTAWTAGQQHVPFDAVLSLAALLTTDEERESVRRLLAEPLAALGFAPAGPTDVTLAFRSER